MTELKGKKDITTITVSELNPFSKTDRRLIIISISTIKQVPQLIKSHEFFGFPSACKSYIYIIHTVVY